MHKKFCLKVGLIIMCIWGLLFAACGPITDTTLSSNITCTPAPSTPDPNTYKANILTEVDLLYSRLFPDQTNYDPNTLQIVKNDAFTLLRDRVRRWSSSNDIPVGDQDVIRITLTYISPGLVQIIILNHQLHQQILSKADFQKKLKDKMAAISVREELIFLTTITYSRYDQNETEENMVVLIFPIKEMALINSGDKHIKANHFDPPLEHEIVISRGPLSGYIAFPFAIEENESCLQIMERQWNTMITINADGFKVKGENYTHPLTWFVKYHSLVEMDGIVPISVTSTAPSGIPTDHQPPLPVRNVPPNQESESYWENMAIHVWTYVVDP